MLLCRYGVSDIYPSTAFQLSKIVINLGRTGDLLSMLPLAYHDAQNGQRWQWMVSKEFSGLFDGVSYVDPIIYDGPPANIGEAVSQAKAINGEWVCAQVNGPIDHVREYVYKPAGLQNAVTTNFQQEAWNILGKYDQWTKQLPLVFDRRSPEREKALIDRHIPRALKKKIVLVATSGNSSPFPHADLLNKLVPMLLSDCKVINLNNVRAERFYDLLGLYERAYCLFATDSAPLHLARACPKLTVFAFTNDQPLWKGSAWQGTHFFYCRYGDFLNRLSEMLDYVRWLQFGFTLMSHEGPRIIHLVSQYEKFGPPRIYATNNWVPTPVQIGSCGRDTENTSALAGETKRLPFLKDVIRMGLMRAGKTDFVCLTRPETQFESGIEEELLKYECSFAYRMDRKEGDARVPEEGPQNNTGANVGADASTQNTQTFVPVVDLFCATASWWLRHLKEIPDVILCGDIFWSQTLWMLFHREAAKDLTRFVWRTARNVERKSYDKDKIPPRTVWNVSKQMESVKAFNVYSRYPRVSEQVECLPLKAHACGYNPSVIDDNGFILMAYRVHTPWQNNASKIWMAQVDDQDEGKLITNTELPLPGRACEDPKLFKWRGNYWMSYVDSNCGEVNWRSNWDLLKSVVKYVKCGRPWTDGVVQPALPGNDGSTMQKNYVMFEYQGELAIIYRCHPNQQTYIGETLHETPGPQWPYGEIRGGTAPIEYEGAWLRFFHSRLNNDGAPTHRYFMGAYLMEKEPPFKVLRVSKKPIVYGSEIDDIKPSMRPIYWKPNVIFPGGVIDRKDHWVVSAGVNDSCCALMKITPNLLNL